MARRRNVTYETLFVKREANFAVRAGLARKARLAGSFICASRACRARLAWLAYDLRGTNDEIRSLGKVAVRSDHPR
jgi:hypothetical protein